MDEISLNKRASNKRSKNFKMKIAVLKSKSRNFFKRRNLIKSLGLLGSSILLPSLKISAFADTSSLRKNQEFLNKRPLTKEKFATPYNNYYEFGTQKADPNKN